MGTCERAKTALVACGTSGTTSLARSVRQSS